MQNFFEKVGHFTSVCKAKMPKRPLPGTYTRNNINIQNIQNNATAKRVCQVTKPNKKKNQKKSHLTTKRIVMGSYTDEKVLLSPLLLHLFSVNQSFTTLIVCATSVLVKLLDLRGPACTQLVEELTRFKTESESERF